MKQRALRILFVCFLGGLLTSTGTAQSDGPPAKCLLGIADENLLHTAPNGGKITYTLTADGCPEGTTALVSFTGLEFTGGLGWSAPASQTAVIADGTAEKEQPFTTTGSGSMKVQLRIQNCNNDDCGTQKIKLSPNPVITSQQTW